MPTTSCRLEQGADGYKYPREVHVVPSLPLTPVGKIDRKALRTRVLQEATA